MKFSPLADAINKGENFIIEKLIQFSKETGFIKYSSTLYEAWRLSVEGISAAITEGSSRCVEVPELHPEEDYTVDSLSSFGIIQAKKHRSRGISLSMFLGLMKYYRQAYKEYTAKIFFDDSRLEEFTLFLERCFDRIELGFVSEWAGKGKDDISREISEQNREITKEKNRYLTIFESLSHPVFFVSKSGEIINLNKTAADTFTDNKNPGFYYYNPSAVKYRMDWIENVITEFENNPGFSFCERSIKTHNGTRIYKIEINELLDFSSKFSGYIITLDDITERREASDRIARLARVYNVLRKTNQAIVRNKNAQSLFDEICRIAVEQGDLQVALINKWHPEREELEKIALCGKDESFLDGIVKRPLAEEAKANISASVLKHKRPYICNNIAEDQLLKSRLGEPYLEGLESVAAFPLFCRGEIYGTLTLYAQDKNFFKPDVVAVFNEMVADITYSLDNFELERQRTEFQWQLAYTSNKLSTLFQAAPLPVIALDKEGTVQMWNPAAEKVFGWREHEVIGETVPIVPEIHLSEFKKNHLKSFSGQTMAGSLVQRKRKDGEMLDLMLFNAPLYDAQKSIYATMGILMDVTEQNKNQEKIVHMAHHDQLTGLPNRSLLKAHFDCAAEKALSAGTRLALCVIDLDEFKYINDHLGHHLGDQLLCEVAARMVDSVRPNDIVCRLGGDEFILLFDDINDLSEFSGLVQKIEAAFSDDFIFEGHHQKISISMGVALFPDDGTDLDTVFKNADAAMYHVKKHGRNNVQFFHQEISRKIHQRLFIESGLRKALSTNELSMHYQPICRVSDDAIVGMEALLRWKHPDLGFVPPGQFIPIAEETNLIITLGEWVVEEVCKNINSWEEQGLPPLPIAINISAKQVFHDGFCDFLVNTVQKYGVNPKRLELEVTESLFMKDLFSVEKVMRKFKKIGFGLSLDDFGTGYSSLAYLRRFMLDKLKIDRSFMKQTGKGKLNFILTDTIILMAKKLKMKSVAEGVETKEHLEFLRQCQCDYYQGYLCSRPMASSKVIEFMRDKRVITSWSTAFIASGRN